MKFVKKNGGYYSEDNNYKILRYFYNGGRVTRWVVYKVIGEDKLPTLMFGDKDNDCICCCKTLKEALARMERISA